MTFHSPKLRELPIATALSCWFDAVIFSDPIERRNRRAVQFMLIVTVLGSLASVPIIFNAALTPFSRMMSLSGSISLAIVGTLSFIMLRYGQFQQAIAFVSLGTVFCITCVLLSFGLADGGSVLFVFALPITFAALLGRQRLMLFISLLMIASVIMVFELEPTLRLLTGTRPLINPMTYLGLFLIAAVAFAIFVGYFSSSLKNALKAATEREHELERMRAQLEEIVEVRTRELRNIEVRQRALIDAMPDALCRIDRSAICLDYRAEKAHRADVEPASLIGRSIIEMMPPHLADSLLNNIARALETQQVIQFEQQIPGAGGLIDEEVRMVASGPDEVVSIIRDITERKAIERMKSEFVSVVSHELRTPLTAIRGALGLVVGGVVGEVAAPARQMLEIAVSNSDRLVRLINDILDVEKIESGGVAFAMQPLALQPLIVQAVAANDAYAAQFCVRLAIVSTTEAVVCADSDRLMQVLTNLISNAVKFSPPDSVATISVEQVGMSVRISVTDCGPGIPHGFRTRIFQKFAQADSSDTRQKGGTGLGLSISKAIIERCGGVIGFASEEGQGATFYFELPIL